MITKKSQGLSVTTIIIAAIALIVLVVLIAIFTGRLGGFSKGVASCTARGGICGAGCNVDNFVDINGDGKGDFKVISPEGKIISSTATARWGSGKEVGCPRQESCCIGIRKSK